MVVTGSEFKLFVLKDEEKVILDEIYTFNS